MHDGIKSMIAFAVVGMISVVGLIGFEIYQLIRWLF